MLSDSAAMRSFSSRGIPLLKASNLLVALLILTGNCYSSPTFAKDGIIAGKGAESNVAGMDSFIFYFL
jgi:hypothetical protein